VKMVVVRLEVEFLLSFIPHAASFVVLQVHKHPLQVGHRVERSPLTTEKQLAKQQTKAAFTSLERTLDV
jgi:hypothetical protein